MAQAIPRSMKGERVCGIVVKRKSVAGRWVAHRCTAMSCVKTTFEVARATISAATNSRDAQRRVMIRGNDSEIRDYLYKTLRSYDPCKEVAGEKSAVS